MKERPQCVGQSTCSLFMLIFPLKMEGCELLQETERGSCEEDTLINDLKSGEDNSYDRTEGTGPGLVGHRRDVLLKAH